MSSNRPITPRQRREEGSDGTHEIVEKGGRQDESDNRIEQTHSNGPSGYEGCNVKQYGNEIRRDPPCDARKGV